ncbi:hypothetical protein M7I_6455 [Glarea lozoyensis 74030]|uniref:Uncharacterized protein n=1 Tax=Glarea lozoyensis (strain ATCC 74030 / MF5533) TaxID=1104152 RepID=H0EUL8_GLAL7|nr:hypothetical protein M7I_6455 [Glarea lozoyensis 74030]
MQNHTYKLSSIMLNTKRRDDRNLELLGAILPYTIDHPHYSPSSNGGGEKVESPQGSRRFVLDRVVLGPRELAAQNQRAAGPAPPGASALA